MRDNLHITETDDDRHSYLLDLVRHIVDAIRSPRASFSDMDRGYDAAERLREEMKARIDAAARDS